LAVDAPTPLTLAMRPARPFPVVVAFDELGDGAVEVFDLLLDEAQQLGRLGPRKLGRIVGQAVLLGDAHLHQRPPSGNQVAQFGLLLRELFLASRADGAGELGEDAGVDRVGLLQPPGSAGELADALGVDDGDRDARVEQVGGEAAVVTPGGLDADEGGVDPPQLGEQRRASGVVVGEGEAAAGKIDEAVQLVLGDVDADDDGPKRTIVLHGGVPALRMRTTPRRGPRRVQPAVRVSTTRPAAILLRDGVRRSGVGTRSIYRRPPPARLLATLRSLAGGMQH